MVIEDNFLLNENEKKYIDELITSNQFPYYYNNIAVANEHYPFLAHVLKFVDKDEYQSPHAEKFIQILDKFCRKHEISYSKVYRAAINLTFNNGYEKSGKHLDHYFDHKQVLIYLNEPKDKESKTVILHNDKEIQITPEKYKAVCFGKVSHYHYTPRFGERIVAVFTFK